MGISYEGIGQVLATFLVEEGVTAGSVVTMTGADTVGIGLAGDKPCGVVLSVEGDGMGAVQLEGMVCVGYTDAAPTVGYNMLACDGNGGVNATDSAGIQCLVVSVDEVSQTAVIKL